MPIEGPAGFFGGLPYVFKVLGARMKRSSVIGAFRREIAVEEKRVGEILRDLGKRARELELRSPALDPVMEQLHALEAQRAQTESGKGALAERLQGEEQSSQERSAECEARIGVAQEHVAALQAALGQRNEELRTARQKLATLDQALKTQVAQRDRRRVEASKAKSPQQREDLEQSAAELALQIGDQERKREAAAAEVGSLEPPIAELSTQLADWRGKLAAAQRDLAAVKQTLAAAKREVGAEDRKLSLEVARLEKEIVDKFLELGHLLDADRVRRPELEELYGRIDEARTGVEAREAQIAQLESERQSFDRRAAKNGKIILLSAACLVVAVVVTLIILFAFVFD